eukprot:s1331_g13.t1
MGPAAVMWPAEMMEPPPEQFRMVLARAAWVLKYFHVGSGRREEWLVLHEQSGERQASFIRRTRSKKNLGYDTNGRWFMEVEDAQRRCQKLALLNWSCVKGAKEHNLLFVLLL